MVNLLPQEDKNHVRRQYLLRVAVIGLVLLSIATAIGIILLSPSYLLSEVREKSALQQTKLLEQSIAFQRKSGAQAEVSATKDRIRILRAGKVEVYVEEILNAALASRPDGVALTSFFYDSKKDPATLTVRGIAVSRESIIELVENLEAQALFTTAKLPVSDLAKDTDIPFTITVIGSF